MSSSSDKGVAPTSSSVPTIMIIDSMEFRRSGVASLLSVWSESCGLRLLPVNLDEAQEVLAADKDIRMMIFSTGGESITSVETIHYLDMLHSRSPEIPLVIIADHVSADDIAAALSIGATGYVHSGSILDLAMQALSFILNGGSYFPLAALKELQSRLRNEEGPTGDDGHHDSGGASLRRRSILRGREAVASELEIDDRPSAMTPREKAVLGCLCQGDSNKMIGRRLGMSETTVKLHVRQIMRKLGATNRTHAAVIVCGSQGVAA